MARRRFTKEYKQEAVSLVQQPNGVFAVVSAHAAVLIKNANLNLFSYPPITEPDGLEISLTFVVAHITVLKFRLHVI
jgi:hypothetical protein